MTRPRIIAAIIITVVVALLLLFAVRVETAFAIGWAVLAGVLVLCTKVLIPDDARSDAGEIPAGPERRGTAIARMAWSLNPRTGIAGELITRRVRGILRHRLLRYGLDTGVPEHRARIDALVGRGLWKRLTEPGTTQKDIENGLDAIDRLSPTLSSTKEKQ